MRTYGRVTNPDGSRSWVVVETDAQGFDDMVYLTTVCQVLKLNLNEAPIFGNYGIPAYQSVVTQVLPDFYAARTQQQFAPYFAALAISRAPGGSIPPVYSVAVTCHNGASLEAQVPT